MKLVCDCGNEMEFINETDQVLVEDYGCYVKKDYSKFDFWSMHDVAGIACNKCDKAIWYFT